jgi:hypothetical protein
MLTRIDVSRVIATAALIWFSAPDNTFSVLRGVTAQEIQFSNASNYELVPILTIGKLEGRESELFGMISDVDRGSDGSIYILEPIEKHVAVFSSKGEFRRNIGSAGAGPGEFLAPANIAVVDSTVVVYDRRLRRVSLFDTNGTYRSSFPVPQHSPTAMMVDRQRHLVLSVPLDSIRAVVYDLSGRKRRSFIPAPPIDGQISGPYVPDPGRVCALPGGRLLYANSWIYELVAYGPEGRESWARTSPRSLLRPVDPLIRGVSPKTQGGVVLGLECDPSRIVLASFAIQSGELHYDILSPEGRPQGRVTFKRGSNESSFFPGFLAAIKADTVLAFRTRPFPQVFVATLRSR